MPALANHVIYVTSVMLALGNRVIYVTSSILALGNRVIYVTFAKLALGNRVIPQTVFTLRGSNGVDKRPPVWCTIPGFEPGTRKRCPARDLVSGTLKNTS